MIQTKILIRHKRSGTLYEVVSCWIPRSLYGGRVKRVLDCIEVTTRPTPILMFLTDPDLWDWSPEQ